MTGLKPRLNETGDSEPVWSRRKAEQTNEVVALALTTGRRVFGSCRLRSPAMPCFCHVRGMKLLTGWQRHESVAPTGVQVSPQGPHPVGALRGPFRFLRASHAGRTVPWKPWQTLDATLAATASQDGVIDVVIAGFARPSSR